MSCNGANVFLGIEGNRDMGHLKNYLTLRRKDMNVLFLHYFATWRLHVSNDM